MASYGRFAEVYDQLMQDIPYDEYVNWVIKNAPSAQNLRLLDIGCGTGVMLEKFIAQGYEVAGLDLSEEMLMMANERLANSGKHVLLVCQSMDELEGFEDLDVITIPIDSLNYLPEQSQVEATFKGIFEALKPGGHLFFDVHSLFKMDEIFMDSPFTYDDDEITYIWDTEAGEHQHSVHHDMTFFVQEEGTHFERFEEYHFQRTFPIQQYLTMLAAAGFEEVNVTADFSENAPELDSQRIFFHAVK